MGNLAVGIVNPSLFAAARGRRQEQNVPGVAEGLDPPLLATSKMYGGRTNSWLAPLPTAGKAPW